jgi:LPXTG-site transpeptidase (sortase) family protein
MLRLRHHLGTLLLVIGVATAVSPLAIWGYGEYWQNRMADDFDRSPSVMLSSPIPEPLKATPTSTRLVLAKTTVPRRRVPRPQQGQPVARLSIKRIGLDAVVVEGTDKVSLRRGPGHLPETALPGESRNCAFAAHRDGWFLRLPEVKSGDEVSVDTKQGRYLYTVGAKKVVTPNRVDLLDQGPRPALTLITCTGPGYPRSKLRLLVFCSLKATYPR